MRIKIKKNTTFEIISTIVLFLYIFYPPITRVNILYLIAVLSWPYVLLNYTLIPQETRRHSGKTIFLNLLMIVYGIVISLVSNQSIISHLHLALYYLFLAMPICLSVFIAALKRNYGFDWLIKKLIIVCSIQGLFSIISYVNSGFHNWYISLLLNYGYEAERYIRLGNYRLYGFAFHLTNYAPLVSVIAMGLLFYLLKDNKKLLIMLPLVMSSIVFNSRTSIALTVILMVFVVVYQSKNVVATMKYIGLTILIILSVIIVVQFYVSHNTNVWFSVYIRSGLESTFDFLTGKGGSGYYSYLSEKSTFVFPEGLRFLFGGGTFVTNGSSYGVGSDVGYINYLWMGGLFYLIIVFATYLETIKPIRKQAKYKVMWWFLLIVFVIDNVKDIVYIFNEFMALVLLTSIFASPNYNKIESFSDNTIEVKYERK